MISDPLLLEPETRVTCPACNEEFSLEQGFAKQALETVEAASAQALAGLRDRERDAVEKRAQQTAGEQAKAAQQQVEDLQRMLTEQRDAHIHALTSMRALTEDAFKPQLDAVKEQLANSQRQLSSMDQREAAIAQREKSIENRVQEAAAVRAAELVAGERQGYEKRLADSHAQVKLLRDEQLVLREERQRLRDEKDALALEVRKQVDAKLAERETAVRTQEQEHARLEKADLQKKLDDAVAQLAAAQRRMEQGSQQLQGEVLELAIEEGLRRTFPLDSIEEVKKGARGGDIIQRVMSRTGQIAGVLLWESKRAKDWSPAWTTKLREDMRGCAADIGILVSLSTAIPREWPAGQLFGLHDEVWVTTWSAALQLAEVLRSGLPGRAQAAADFGRQGREDGGGLRLSDVAAVRPEAAGRLRRLPEDAGGAGIGALGDDAALGPARKAAAERTCELLGVAGDIQGLAQQELPALEMEPPAST